MNRLKNILKSIGIGALYLLLSFTVYQLVDAMISTFKDMMNYNGIYAVLFFFSALLIGGAALLTIFLMGAFPLATIYYHRENEVKDK